MHGEPRIEKNRSMRTSGIPFTCGPLAHLLRNRFYFREVTFKGEILKGRTTGHSGPGLVRRSANQAQRTSNKSQGHKDEARSIVGRSHLRRSRQSYEPNLRSKRGIKYRYDLSSALMQGTAERAGSMRRAPAAEIEHMVLSSVRDHFKQSDPIDDRSLINNHVVRVEVQARR